MTEKYADTHKCKDCKFYRELYSWNVDSKGTCHCSSPRPLVNSEEDHAWPTVRGNDFCGEFAAKKEQTNDRATQPTS